MRMDGDDDRTTRCPYGLQKRTPSRDIALTAGANSTHHRHARALSVCPFARRG